MPLASQNLEQDEEVIGQESVVIGKKEEATSSNSSSFKIQNLKFNILLFPHSRSFASIRGSIYSFQLSAFSFQLLFPHTLPSASLRDLRAFLTFRSLGEGGGGEYF